MFETSHPFLPLEYLRVPHTIVPSSGDSPLGEVRVRRARSDSGRTDPASAPALFWPLPEAEGAAPRFLKRGPYLLEEMPVHCRVVPDAAVPPLLNGRGSGWMPAVTVRDARGAHVASVWRDAQGSVFLPFDPGEAMLGYWSEAYRETSGAGSLKRLAMRAYYRARPLLPRAAQIRLRQAFTRVQARTRFPRWPVEAALHDLYEWLLRQLAAITGAPVPWIAPWPSGHRWALVLTHDVETQLGYDHLSPLQDVERRYGFRSSWNFVPRRYQVEDSKVAALAAAGNEVGVHGLYHDGRDLESLPLLESRLSAIREHAARWNAVGFRAPATHRVWDWMPLLGFEYDSSYPDTDPFEPMGGGCCTWLPYFNRSMVELPITLPQDHTVFVIQGQRDARAWLEKAEYLRTRGGMALLITHPDYMIPAERLQAYEALLDRFADDASVWRALPRDVSAWWRRRAGSSLESTGDSWDTWRVTGPAAAEADVRYTLAS